jgi:hypothetical protein
MDNEWFVTVVAWVQSEASGFGIYGAQCGMGSVQVLHFFMLVSFYQCSIFVLSSVIDTV